MVSYTRSIDSATEPVTLDEAKAAARITTAAEDFVLDAILKGARIHLEDTYGLAFVEQTWVAVYDWHDIPRYASGLKEKHRYHRHFQPIGHYSIIELPRYPLLDVTSIVYVDLDGNDQTLDASHYVIDAGTYPGRVFPAYNDYWPNMRSQNNAMTITYTAGVEKPEEVRETYSLAIKLLFAYWANNREAYIQGQLTELPIGVTALLGLPIRTAKL